MKPVAKTDTAVVRVPATQFLFSGRGPLRREQIAQLLERSALPMPREPLFGSREARR